MQSIINFFDPVGGHPNGSNWALFISAQYWIGIIFFVAFFSTIFIFKNFYFKLVNSKKTLITIGIIHLTLYLIYYLLNFIYLYWYYRNSTDIDPRLRGWTWIFPLHVSSIGQLLSGILLIKFNEKVFRVTAPWIVILVFVSILMPGTRNVSFGNYFYWDYFINHTLILMVFWMFYMYRPTRISLDRKTITASFSYLLVFSMVALMFNVATVFSNNPNEITNFLFIGQQGFPLWNGVSTANFFIKDSGNSWSWIQGYPIIAVFGSIFLFIGFWVLRAIKPFHARKSTTKN